MLLTDEQKIHAFDALWNNSFSGLAVVNKEGKFLAVNRQFCRLLKISPADVIDKTFQSITPYPYKNIDEDNARLLIEGKGDIYVMPKEYEFSGDRKIKAVLMVRRIPPSADGEFELFLSSIILDENKRSYFSPASIVDFFMKYAKLFGALGAMIAGALFYLKDKI